MARIDILRNSPRPTLGAIESRDKVPRGLPTDRRARSHLVAMKPPEHGSNRLTDLTRSD
jgi:hypothetical protein